MAGKKELERNEVDRAAMMLIATGRLIHGLSVDELRKSGLRPPQAGFLVFLLHAGPMNMSAMSRISNVTSSVATRLVERLEAKGMARRVPGENDRRVVMVVLTDQGKRTAEALLEAYSRGFEELMEGIDPEDLQAFLRVLEHVHVRFARKMDLGDIGDLLESHGIAEGG